MEDAIRAVAGEFRFQGELRRISEIVSGHINRTYRLDYALPEGGQRAYILQRINTYAFKRPDEMMDNVVQVTRHLRMAMAARGKDPRNRVLKCVQTHSGGVLYRDPEGQCWRAYDFIENAVPCGGPATPVQFIEVGRAFGQFQKMLSDFPIGRLHDTIPDFHDTRKRYQAFEASVAKARADHNGRAGEVEAEIAFFRARAEAMGRIVDMIGTGEIPLRVTHNDTKCNNVMLDADTGEALCVIDLDTVMAGSALYDFGDAIRFGASTAAEDEADLSRVALDMNMFASFARGFLGETAEILTPCEVENLPLGAMVMTYEVALRFLKDYLDGDVYFRIHYPGHNLVRARTQMRLLESMEENREGMNAIVNELARNLGR